MKRRAAFKWTTLTGISLASVAERLVAQAALNQEFVKIFEGISPEYLHADLAPAALYSNKLRLKGRVVNGEYSDAVSAAMNLWIVREESHLLLTWYRETSRAKRALICALYLCDNILVLDEPTDGVRTDFELAPSRFGPNETVERQDELEYVISNARDLSKKFIVALSKVVPKEKLKGFEYTAGISDKSITRLLRDAKSRTAKQ